ncbi:MAG TPA: hypothetical protein VKC89_02035 [Patescibacteria group bacterium]|nr:hypothetical protein [Patescibacteria group bacterium]
MERRDISRLFHLTAGRGIALAREEIAIRNLDSQEIKGCFFVGNPLYINQMANADRNKIEGGLLGKINDPEAAIRFGTSNVDEFSYWAWRSCGVVNLQMVLASINPNFNKSTMDLVREGLDAGGYDVAKDVGWYHKGLIKLANQYGVRGETKKFIPSSQLAVEIFNGRYVMASVKSRLKDGHILLLFGIKTDERGNLAGFFAHDSNGLDSEGISKFISKSDFDKISTRRAILLSIPHE